MLVRLIPKLDKYAMDSSIAVYLFSLVIVMVVAKYILEQMMLLKRYEAFWVYHFLSVILLIGLALIQDVLIDLYIVIDLVICIYSGITEYRRHKKSRKWENNIPKEHDELLQYIIEECVYLYSDQLIEFGEYMDKETNIIFQLYGKRNDAVSITLDEYFSALPINEIIDKIKAELDKQSSEKDA